MAYVGCIAGAILIDDYRRMLWMRASPRVEIIDSGRDLNAYAKVENQAGCCSSPQSTASALRRGRLLLIGQYFRRCSHCVLPLTLTDLLSRYNVNDYAASVKVFAVKPT